MALPPLLIRKALLFLLPALVYLGDYSLVSRAGHGAWVFWGAWALLVFFGRKIPDPRKVVSMAFRHAAYGMFFLPLAGLVATFTFGHKNMTEAADAGGAAQAGAAIGSVLGGGLMIFLLLIVGLIGGLIFWLVSSRFDKKSAVLAGVIFTLLAASAPARASAAFPDVPPTNPHADAISYLADRGILGGYPDGTFQPDRAVSRIETLKILLLGAKIPVPETGRADFPDVPPSHWGQKYLALAASRGIASGNPDGTFRPGDRVTMAAALKMLALANGLRPADFAGKENFFDVPADAWFAPFAALAKTKNLVPGDRLAPSQTLTRGALAELIYRLAYARENDLDAFQKLTERKVTISKIYDGDTLTTDTGEKIRVIGIDTPEKGENWDLEATALARSLLLEKVATIKVCDAEPKDRYGRTLAAVRAADGTSLAEALLKKGLAKTYHLPPCGDDTADFFASLEAAAKSAKIGIWATAATPAAAIPAKSSRSAGAAKKSSAPARISTPAVCGTKKYCGEMADCAEARFFLNSCGLDRLDRDRDGIPCESLCGG